jgi:hypothetical protein
VSDVENYMLNTDLSFIAAMENKRDGANNHAINKALTYYKVSAKQDNQHWLDLIANTSRAAMASGDYKPLSYLLRNLW